MPSHEEHCEDSLRRYGKRFDELHRWMDEPSTLLGPGHRKYRHDPNTTPQIARELFGPLADQACLDHIRLDHLESRRIVRREPTILSTFVFGLGSLIFFLIGIMFLSMPRYVSDPFLDMQWYAGVFMVFLMSFVCFLAFIGSLSGGKVQTRKPLFSEEKKQSDWPPLKTCPTCGTTYDAGVLKNCPKCEYDKERERRM